MGLTSRYAWIIDRDVLAEGEAAGTGERLIDTEVGTTGPRHAPDAFTDILSTGPKDTLGRHGTRGTTPDGRPYLVVSFRMYDDDDELYYTGRYIERTDGHDAADAGLIFDEGFGPLQDFGEPNAGCTRLDYKSHTTGQWSTL